MDGQGAEAELKLIGGQIAELEVAKRQVCVLYIQPISTTNSPPVLCIFMYVCMYVMCVYAWIYVCIIYVCVGRGH